MITVVAVVVVYYCCCCCAIVGVVDVVDVANVVGVANIVVVDDVVAIAIVVGNLHTRTICSSCTSFSFAKNSSRSLHSCRYTSSSSANSFLINSYSFCSVGYCC